MRIFAAGATGAIGRPLLPLPHGHDVAGMTPPDGAAAPGELAQMVEGSGMATRILRFGLQRGPHTWHADNPGEPGRLHVREAAEAIVAAL